MSADFYYGCLAGAGAVLIVVLVLAVVGMMKLADAVLGDNDGD